MSNRDSDLGSRNPELIRFVYFDLDDTLLDHRHAERQALAEVCGTYAEHFGRFALETVQETYHRHNVVLWQQYSAGRVGKMALKRLRFEQLLNALAVDGLAAEEVSDHYLDCYARHWQFPAPAREAFDEIADHLPVGVLTNGFTEIQQHKLERFPEIRERLRAVVISEEVGHLKPHPKLFAHATARAGVPPGAILYVGDSYLSDVEGALQAGWQIAWYTTDDVTETPASVFRFDQWPALTTYVRERTSR